MRELAGGAQAPCGKSATKRLDYGRCAWVCEDHWHPHPPYLKAVYIDSPDECSHTRENACRCVVYEGPGKHKTWTREYGWFTVE